MNRREFIGIGAATLASIALPSVAFAAGKLSYEENFYVAGEYMSYAVGLAKVENVGDKPIMVNSALLEVFDSEGNPLTSVDYFAAHAEYLQPGEYTYVKIYDNLDTDQVDQAEDYMLTISGKTDNSEVTHRLPCIVEYKFVEEDWWSHHYIYATVTNDSDEPIYDTAVVAAVYDTNGTMVAIQDDYLYNIAIEPGSSITFRMEVDSTAINYCEKNGIEIGSADAIAYVNVPNPLG